MKDKKRILLKLTGKVLSAASGQCLGSQLIEQLIAQIKKLKDTHLFGIVVGGGNILRGDEQGAQLGLCPSVGHQAGMLATMINGLILKDLLGKHNIEATLLSAIVCPQICDAVSQVNIEHALKHERILIFVGGTGAPFFTTDTNALVRALQMGAAQVWKGTDVDGAYSGDPRTNKDATLIKKIKYCDAISQKLGIMDTASLTLAQKHGITIKVFNIFEENALIKADKNQDFGSLIY